MIGFVVVRIKIADLLGIDICPLLFWANSNYRLIVNFTMDSSKSSPWGKNLKEIESSKLCEITRAVQTPR